MPTVTNPYTWDFDGEHCGICNAPIEQPNWGRPREFCSSNCRRKASLCYQLATAWKRGFVAGRSGADVKPRRQRPEPQTRATAYRAGWRDAAEAAWELARKVEATAAAYQYQSRKRNYIALREAIAELREWLPANAPNVERAVPAVDSNDDNVD